MSFVVVPRAARGDAKMCAAAAEAGQRARAAAKLREASASFLRCSSDDCPALVRRDCQEWSTATRELLPTIIVDARDGQARDVGDVRVTMDGEVLAESVVGTEIPVDPGPHTFVFARRGSANVTEKVIIKERAKGRTFVVRFDAPTPSEPAEASTEPAGDEPPAAVEGRRSHTVAPWILVGVGGAVVVAGAIVLITNPKVPSNCNADNGTCKEAPGETAAQLDADRRTAGESTSKTEIGAIAIIAGAAILTGGLLWHFLEPTGERSTRTTIAPWSTMNAAGIGASGTF